MRHALALLGLLLSTPGWAALNIFATVPEWGALAEAIGGDQVKVYTATTAKQDPHRIEARPSLLAQARRAHLLIATGADLEVGWLPLVQRESGNSAIQSGQSGYVEAASWVPRLDIPTQLDRAHGDVHASGNPHVHLDPRNLLLIGAQLSKRMAELDPPQAKHYQTGYERFAAQLEQTRRQLETLAQPLRGQAVISHHESFRYLFHWLGIRHVGTLEPKPGIEPTRTHLGYLLTQHTSSGARMVVHAAYQPAGPSQWLAQQAGIPVILLPYTVGGSPEARDLPSLLENSVQRLLQGLR